MSAWLCLGPVPAQFDTEMGLLQWVFFGLEIQLVNHGRAL